VAKSFEQVKAETDAEYARLQALQQRFISTGQTGQRGVVERQMQQQVAIRDEAAGKQTAEFNAWNENNPPAGVRSAQDAYYDGLAAEKRESAKSFLRNLLTQYGLGSLASAVDSIVQDTTSEEVIAERLRNTQEYKTRFKGLTQLRAKGVTDIANEGEYLRLESNYRQVFREVGMSSFLGDAGTQSEFDSIAKLVGDYSLSVNEVRDRVTDAQRIVAETPQEVRDSFQRYYNVDPATLTAYVLDPTSTANEINRRANAAIIGGLGMQRGLEFGSGAAERIGTFLGGDQNLTGTQAEPVLGEIADVQRATGRLAQLEKSTLSAEETAFAQLDLNSEAKRKVKGLQSRERARFGGTGAFGSGALGGTNKV
jgi:hypothetical protein